MPFVWFTVHKETSETSLKNNRISSASGVNINILRVTSQKYSAHHNIIHKHSNT
jgi:hypothetical protein